MAGFDSLVAYVDKHSEVTLVIEEHELARLLFLPGRLELIYTHDETGDTVTMSVYEVIGYRGPVVGGYDG